MDAAAYLQATYGGEEAVFGGGSAPSEAAGFERDFAAELDGFLATGGGSVPVVAGSWGGDDDEPKSGGTLEALLVSIGGGGDDGAPVAPGSPAADIEALITGGEPAVVGGGAAAERPTAVLIAAPETRAHPVANAAPATTGTVAAPAPDISDLIT